MNLDINLRPYGSSPALRQTGKPTTDIKYVTNSDTGTIECLFNIRIIPGDNPLRSDGLRHRFFARGLDLLAVCNDRYRTIATLPASPTGIIASDGGIIVLLDDGFAPVKFTRHGVNRWTMEPTPARLAAPFAITRADMGQLAATIPSKMLKGEYNSRSTRLTTSDADTLGKAMGEAYCTLSDAAMTRRQYIQPVMARYRIRNKYGELAYLSAPVLITPATPIQGAEATFTLSGDHLNLTAETELRAESFTLKLTPCADFSSPDGWNDIIGSVDILMSTQLHLYQPGVAPIHRFNNFTASAGSLTMRLPGVTDSPLPAAEGSRLHAMITGLLDRLDSALNPDNGLRHDTLDEISILCKILDPKTKELTAEGRIMASLSSPHSFAATHAARSGNTIVWGNLQSIPFQGYSAAELAVTTSAVTVPVPTVSCVNFGSGETVVNPSSLTSARPEALSPLLTYPSPEATEITVSVGTRTVTRQLKVSPSGRWAYFLNPSATPVALDTETDSFVIPAENPPSRHLPDAAIASGAESPLAPRALAHCAGEIITITPTSLPVSSWDFARANFYAFTDSGSCALAVNSKRDSITAMRLDTRGIKTPDAVALTPDGVMAIADGDLVRLNSNRVTTVLTGLTANRIGWSQPHNDESEKPCPPAGELWCVTDATGEILVTSPDGKHRYLRDGIIISELFTTSDGLLATTPDGEILNLSLEQLTAASAVEHTCRYAIPHRHGCFKGNLLQLIIPVFGAKLKGYIDIRADNGLGIAHSCSLTRLDIDGDINSPVNLLVPTPSRTHISIVIRLEGNHIAIDPPVIAMNSAKN